MELVGWIVPLLARERIPRPDIEKPRQWLRAMDVRITCAARCHTVTFLGPDVGFNQRQCRQTLTLCILGTRAAYGVRASSVAFKNFDAVGTDSAILQNKHSVNEGERNFIGRTGSGLDERRTFMTMDCSDSFIVQVILHICETTKFFTKQFS